MQNPEYDQGRRDAWEIDVPPVGASNAYLRGFARGKKDAQDAQDDGDRDYGEPPGLPESYWH